MTEPYCGIKQVPKNKHRGNMKECIAKNAVRYWGVNTIDSKLLQKALQPTQKLSRVKLLGERVKLNVRMKKLKKLYDDETSKTKKKHCGNK